MRIAAFSDTHGFHRKVDVPDADVLVFAGDTELRGSEDFLDFCDWWNSLPHKTKVFVAGNHDWHVFSREDGGVIGGFYLEDNGIIVNNRRFHGSPWSPEYGKWAFQKPRGDEMAEVWSNIPSDTEILVTHTPPYETLDLWNNISPVGCKELKKRVAELPKLKAHIFGHIHEGYGRKGNSYNVAICDLSYTPRNPVTVIDL